MIDWSKVGGPSGTPKPDSTGDTTTPIAPIAPGGIPSLPGLPTPVQSSPYKTGSGYHEASQAQVNAMDPGQRIARGIDFLGDKLFGRGNGSPLGGIPLLGDIVGAAGNFTHGLLNAQVVKPIEAGATGLSSIPLGWLPGGSDEAFNKIGEWAKTKDPQLYQHWQMVNAAAGKDVLGGGNLKADFNMEAAQYLDDQQKTSSLGVDPVLAMGREGVGSVGGALSHAIQGWLGLPGAASQRWLGEAGVFDPTGGVGQTFEQQRASFEKGNPTNEDAAYAFKQLQSGKFTEQQARDYLAANQGAGRNRIEEIAARFDRGDEVSDVEKHALEAYRSGAWTIEHAQDYLVSHGQGITRNPVGQIAGSVLTDPLTYATIGAGSIAKAGQVGEKLLSTGRTAENIYQKFGMTVAEVNQSSHLGGVFRAARGLIDPLGVYKPSTIERATNEITAALVTKAFSRAYGPGMQEARAIGREFNMTHEVDSAIASYGLDQATLMKARVAQHDIVQEGLGLEAIHTNPDDVLQPLMKNGSRDAETELTDHLQTTAHNTFTPEENANLAGRMAVTFGQDVPYWKARLAGMSFEGRQAMHAITYKRAEVGFEQARAAIDAANYTGKLPIRNAVLMTSDTLDDVTTGYIIDNIRSMLKSDTPDKIEAATAEWNGQAQRYPKMQDIGYAPGGETQLKSLVRELEKLKEKGGVSRRALPDELSDPQLKPWQDFLDRNTIPGQGPLEPAQLRPGSYADLPIDDPGYFYHVTDAGSLADIRDQGIVPHTPDARGEQQFWPDGTDASRSYFSGSSKATQPFSESNPAILRVKNTGGFKVEKGTPDFITEQTIPPSNVEYLKADGTWAPITEQEPGGAPLWRIGFRPDESVAWGLNESPITGRYIVTHDPTISHVVDAVPGRQPFSDTTRNVLGQVVGKGAAEHLNAPVDSLEAFVNTMRDVVTGRRLVTNIEKRFERSTFDAGFPKPISKAIMDKASELAALHHTTIRGITPDNLWTAIKEADLIPRDLVLKDGTRPNIHTIMDHLLVAAEGDLRIMGVSSVLSQRMRNALRRTGLDPVNWSGYMTVTMYNKLRYSQPIFLIQRVTDAPYYSILYGVTPVGRALKSAPLKAMRAIEENLGRTGLGRYFSIDMPEYATRSNFTEGIKSAMQQAGLDENKLSKIADAPNAIIASNMTNMLYNRMGDIFQGALENAGKTVSEDPALAAEALAAGEKLKLSVNDWRRIYSEEAGHLLNDNELGLRYVQDQLGAWRHNIVNPDGSMDFKGFVAEGNRHLPSDVGAIESIRPEDLAKELGYPDSASLRKDISGTLRKIGQEYIHVPGETDLARFEENLRTKVGAHPDYIRRATAYYGDTYEGFWSQLERPVEEGGLDISPHYAQEAKDLIAVWARDRGMDPWEYISGVMSTNIGAQDLNTAMGQLFAFLKSGKAEQPIEEWTKIFRSTLDVSAQQTLLKEFEQAVPIEDVIHVPTPGAFGKDAAGNAKMPMGYGASPGYVYRIDVLDKMRGGWRKGEGVSTDAAPFYASGRPGEGVFRSKIADADLAPGRNAAAQPGGKDRLTKAAVPPEQIEMLDPSGNWVPLGEDPMVKIMAKDFPEEVRKRLMSDVPHQNPEVEAYIQQFSKWVQQSLAPELGAQTRKDLRRLVQQASGTAPAARPAENLTGATVSSVYDRSAKNYVVRTLDKEGNPIGEATIAATKAERDAAKTQLEQQIAANQAAHHTADLADLSRIPTGQAAPFNRTHFLIISLLKDKIEQASQDVFRLAEMQTKRTVLERSINHPLFALYPASYMWGKVLPETVKFIAKNPYAATYAIADVQRAIAIQREYDREMDDKVSAVDRSAGAFLLDYLTPGLPWSDHQARMSPLFRGILNGKDLGELWKTELDTVSPQRWVAQVINTLNEVPGAVQSLGQPTQQTAPWEQGLQQIEGGATPTAPAAPQQITGPTRASALAPILEEDLNRLSSILLQGASPEK